MLVCVFTYKHDCIFVAYIVSLPGWVWFFTTSIKGDWDRSLLLWPFSFVPIYDRLCINHPSTQLIKFLFLCRYLDLFMVFITVFLFFKISVMLQNL